MSRTFPCARCGTPVPVPDEALRDATISLHCGKCGQRYVRKPGATPTGATARPSRPIESRASDAPTPGAATPTAGPTPSPTVASGPTRPLRGSSPPTFEDDETVAGRYRIVRFVARGGMGEVYEAEDLELRGRVALKTIQSAIATESGATDRFKREIQLARRVTHPNVCRIFDVGYHATSPEEPPVVFLTMELLEGETLAERLRRNGRLTSDQALPIAGQLVDALAAAHAAGVVHRDLKSENVTLVPGPAGERAVVTDFGIARGGEESFAVTLTSDSGVLGTPAYMAPEQIEGGPVTPAVDQYALGVVLFEMVTGDVPFHGETALATAARRLTEPAPSPREVVEDLDPIWERVILRCLARRPEERFSEVAAVARELRGESHEAPPRSRRRTRSERRKRAVAAALLAVLAGVGAWSVWRVRQIRDRLELGTPVAARRGIALLGFRNLTGRAESDWLSTALAEMLGGELGRSRELRVVPGDTVIRALLDLGLEPGSAIDEELRARLVRRLGADELVVGSYALLPETGALRLDLRLEDARSGETRTTLTENGREAELFELVSRLGEGLRTALDVSLGTGGEAKHRATPEGVRLYSQGLDALRRLEPERARELLERAIAVDPDNALAHSALAAAWGSLGYRQRAQEEAARARELAGGLAAEERLVIEARYFESSGEWERAAELWQRLWTAFPDSLAHGLRVAFCRTQAGEPEKALAAATALRELPPPDGEDPRIDLAEAIAAGAQADFARQAEAAERAASRALVERARQVAAEALVVRAWALRNLGELDEARAQGERASALYAEAGDRSGVASADAALGGILLVQGDLESARAAYERSLTASRELGDRGGEARALNNLAVVERTRGEMVRARETYEEVARLCAEIADRAGAAVSANNLAAILAELGELDAARARAEEALEVWRDTGNRGGVASALGNLGSVRRREGDLAGAERAWEESLALRRETGQRPAEAVALNGLAQTLLDRGDLVGAAERFAEAERLAREVEARGALASALAGSAEVAAARGDSATAVRLLEEALELRRASGERLGVAAVRLAQARLVFDRDPATAAMTAHELLAGLVRRLTPELEAGARAIVARAELVSGRPDRAEEELAPALELVPRLGRVAGLEIAVAAARSRAARGEIESARAELARVREEASSAGLRGIAFEAELAEAELGAGDLEQLARRARAAGFEQLARRAEAAEI